MKRYYTIINYLLCSICLFWMTACSGMLDDMRPKDQIPQDMLSESDLEKLLNGVYAEMEELIFKFYMEGNLVYTSVQDAVTNEPDSKDIFQQDFEVSSSMRLEGPNGVTSPFPAGRYEVELYLKTEELDEHFVMRRTLDVR